LILILHVLNCFYFQGFTYLATITIVLSQTFNMEILGNMDVLPDIVLIDVNMPVMEGPEAVEILRNKYPDLRMVALSVNTDLQHIRKMIEAGANAYLFKDSIP